MGSYSCSLGAAGSSKKQCKGLLKQKCSPVAG